MATSWWVTTSAQNSLLRPHVDSTFVLLPPLGFEEQVGLRALLASASFLAGVSLSRVFNRFPKQKSGLK